MNPLSVTHLSTTDSSGGAAVCASRLHQALAALGIHSQMLVAQQFTPDGGTVEYNPLAPAPPWLGRLFFRLGRRLHRPSFRRAGGFFTFDWTVTGWRLLSQLPASDLVHLHWVADLLDYATLPRMTRRTPVVWTFHDMNAFTGGCHYSGACQRYSAQCGSCPQLKSSRRPDDATRRCFQRKRRIFQRIHPARLAVVCPSRWIAREAARSPLFRDFSIRVIPSGLDIHAYRPVERAQARRRFGLPEQARIVLFVADNVEDRRKGLPQLLEAADALRDIPDLLLVTIGRGGGRLPRTPIFRHLGVLSGFEALRAAYSAADVFAMPSLQDNFPNTIVESMACGTPVVGFDCGGVSEAVQDGKTGLLAPSGDTAGLAGRLRRVLENEGLRGALGAESRALVERSFSSALQAARHAELYREMLGYALPDQLEIQTKEKSTP